MENNVSVLENLIQFREEIANEFLFEQFIHIFSNFTNHRLEYHQYQDFLKSIVPRPLYFRVNRIIRAIIEFIEKEDTSLRKPQIPIPIFPTKNLNIERAPQLKVNFSKIY
jgi:hypothetical protein